MTPTIARLTDSQPPLPVICCWCPDWNPRDPANKGASHGMCEACRQKAQAELDAADVQP